MKYRNDRTGSPISQLGFGCMRFTKKGSVIDYDKAEEAVLLAVDRGVNYFDTAYVYLGSEKCLGDILARNNIRDKVNIAAKLPQYMIRSEKEIEKIFQEELSRLRTDHIDHYLMHMFTDYAEFEKLQTLGIEEWIHGHKGNEIGSVGFSFHGNTETFLKILNAYDWDFCQIQYNYLDEHSQAGRAGLEAAKEKGVPVIIMEPLRGGKLIDLPDEAMEELQKYGCTPAKLGLRWLWDQEGILCVLSGMNSNEMVEENARIADEAEIGCFTDEEKALTERVIAMIREREKVGCTGCRYCMPCPNGVDIPSYFHYYNLMYMENKAQVRFEFMRNMGNKGLADRCTGCGKCEAHCPQKIPIREMLKQADSELRPAFLRAAANMLFGR